MIVEKLNSSSAQSVQFTQKTSLMSKMCLSFFKLLPTLNLSKVGLFKVSNVVLFDYRLPRQHMYQGVPSDMCLSDSYTIGSDIMLSDYSLSGQHLHQDVPPGLRLSDNYTR
jgi:hypothetical protein